MMGKVVADHQRDWTDHLPKLMAAYRSAVHEATGYSPNMLILGREMHAPLDLTVKVPSDAETNSDTYVDQILEQFYQSYRQTRESLQTRTLVNKRYYDISTKKTCEYTPGTWVWYYKPKHVSGTAQKWERYFTGPYRIMRQLGPVNLVLQSSANAQPFVKHIDKVKPYKGDTPITFDSTANNSNAYSDDDDDNILYQLNDENRQQSQNTVSNHNAPTVEKENTEDAALPAPANGVDDTRLRRQRRSPAHLEDYDLC